MSLHRHINATLSSYIGPIFPLSIDRLAFELSRCPLNQDWINRAASPIDGFAGTDSEMTSDGYHWLCSVRFNRHASSITILLPQSLATDRSPAVYIWGATDDMAEALVIEFIEAISLQCDLDEIEAGSDTFVLALN